MSERALMKKELKALGKTDATIPAITSRWVRDSLVMSEGEVKFSWRQYRFANIYRRTLDLDLAAQEAGMPRESALRFLRRPDVVRWLDDRAKMADTKRTWSAEGRWWAEGDIMYRQPEVPKHRMEIWREFGERLDVKPGRGSDSDLTSNRISINIAPEVIATYREREKAMEAEITSSGSERRGSPEPRKDQS